MNLQRLLILTFISIVASEYKCTESDCHDCIDNVCHLTCQGIDCIECPNGDCCDGQNCNVCYRSICCSTKKCNECVISNRESCFKETSDPSICDNLVEEKCGLHVDKAIIDGSINTGQNRHNITTVIRILNRINNTNVIDAPIVLNSTNVQDVLLNNTGKLGASHRRTCCSIVHPQECHTIVGLPNKLCFTRQHTECSRLCGNSTNLIIKNGGNEESGKCIFIAVHPYYYCGSYTTEDCSACYNCKDKSKIECLYDPKCSNSCRSSVLPRRFYNVPYLIKSSNGSQVPPAQK